ncbi:hypothetical protein PGTUg99_007927 [Puccinia graminis f. sp. tritici]|uniref:Uncharacterized protein n=1 Tax=Puccinia graminis f. sp. tritici TaxID=56615 RepID=A0A5B0SJH0_PUCGR|nr:hypothetical protein PGTUg99_007927 [Puccinia graminis f. sp. tritici]
MNTVTVGSGRRLLRGFDRLRVFSTTDPFQNRRHPASTTHCPPRIVSSSARNSATHHCTTTHPVSRPAPLGHLHHQLNTGAA